MTTVPRLIIEDLRQMGVEVELVSGERSPVEIHVRFPPGTSEGFIDTVRDILRPHCGETLSILLEEGEDPDGDAGAGRSRTGDGRPEAGDG